MSEQVNILSHHGVKGMHWGVRRYQNPDGTLTNAGKKRYNRDIQENLSKKKENRIDTSSPDPRRWAKEDLERSKDLIDTSADLVKQMNKLEKESRPKPPAPQKMDLTKMSDKELRDRINRELLEQQYNKLFSEQPEESVSKGRQHVQDVLEVSGTVLALTSSALGIALAIQKLKTS